MPARLLTDCLSVVSGSNCRCATASRGSVTVRRARATTPAKIHRAVEAKPGTTRQYAFERFSMQQNFVLPRPIAALCGQHSGAGRVWIEKDLFRDHCLPIWLKKCGRAGGPFWAMAHVAEVRISPTSPRGCWRATANTRLLKRRYHGRWFHCFRPKSSERQRHIPHTHTYTHTHRHTPKSEDRCVVCPSARCRQRRNPVTETEIGEKKKARDSRSEADILMDAFSSNVFKLELSTKKNIASIGNQTDHHQLFISRRIYPSFVFRNSVPRPAVIDRLFFFWKKNETQIELNNFQG